MNNDDAIKYKPLIKSCINKFANNNNYHDLLQEGYIALLTAIKSYNKNRGYFIPYAKCCIYNHLCSYVSRQKIYEELLYTPLVYENTELFEVLPELSTKDRKLLELRLNGYTYREIAAQYNKSISTISQQIKKIIKYIQESNEL